MVDELFFEGGYRPPWLWSVAHVLAETADVDAIVVSDPVGHGSDRGAHNCGECDDRVQTAIKDFDKRQDPSVFEQVSCACADDLGGRYGRGNELQHAARSVSRAGREIQARGVRT
jgi:Predicted Fe-S oxidoreductase